MLTLSFKNGTSFSSAVAINVAFANGIESRCLLIRCDGECASQLELLPELLQSSEILISHSPRRILGSEQCLQSAVRMLKDERIELWSAINSIDSGAEDNRGFLLSRQAEQEVSIDNMRLTVNGKEKFRIDSFDRYEQVGIVVTLRGGTESAMVLAHGLLRGGRKEVVWLKEDMPNEVELGIQIDRAVSF